MNGWMNKWWDDRSRDPCKHIECSEGNGRKKKHNWFASIRFTKLRFYVLPMLTLCVGIAEGKQIVSVKIARGKIYHS